MFQAPVLRWFLLPFFLTSCATARKVILGYKLKQGRDQKSRKAAYQPPPPPFQFQKSENLDALWWNPKTQSSISYFSSCPKTGLPSLKEIERGVLSEVENYQILQTQQTKNTRRTKIQISDSGGGKTLNSIHTLKTSGCFYILNFVSGSRENFKKDEPVFQKFTARFKGS